MRIALGTLLASLALAVSACGGDDETTTTTTTGATGATGATGEEDGSADNGGSASGGGGTPSSDELLVTQAIEGVIGGGDPEATCAASVTQHYVKAAYGDEEGCRAAVEEQGTFEVEVESLKVNTGLEGTGPSGIAEASAVPEGGPNKGEKLTVRLEYRNAAWRVAYLDSTAPAGP